MNTRLSSAGEFPIRMGHRLGLALTAAIGIILLGAGIFVYQSFQMSRVGELVDHENEHVLTLEKIDTTFDDIISEFEYMKATGLYEELREIRDLQADLTRHLERFRSIHKAEWEAARGSREQALLTMLQEYAGEIKAVAERLAAMPSPSRSLTAGDLDRLHVISHDVPTRVEELRDIHRIGIGRILQGGKDKTWGIAMLYLALVLFGGTLIAVASSIIHRRIVTPLQTLANAALGIAEGRPDERVPIRSSDEMGQVSHAFNVMADRLQAHERDLQAVQDQLEQKVRETRALYRIGSEISDLHRLDRVLQSLVEKTRELLRSDAAKLCIFAQDINEVSGMTASGPPEAFVGGPCSRRCMGVTGEDLATPDQPCSLIRPEYLQAYLAAPIRRGGSTLGVLYACRREARAFTRDESELLDGLATGAAIAIQNARLYESGQSLATLQERERIAREMHDGLAQALGLLHLKLSRAQEAVVAGNHAQIASALSEMKVFTQQTYDEVRQSIFGLRTMVSHRLGLIPSLTEYLHEFSVQSGIPVEFTVDNAQPIRLSPASEVQLIRIVQEGLTNVHKHAGAGRAWVRIQRQASWIQVTIEDDGRGFEPATLASPDRYHFGFQTMRERAEGLGGKLEIDTSPGHGTRVVATLPQEV